MTETDQPHIISDAMLEAYNLAHNDWWKASAPVLTQGQATVVDREAMRAGLRAVLDALTAAGRLATCPCLPGAPEHQHNRGGYCTRPDQADLVAAAEARGWHRGFEHARRYPLPTTPPYVHHLLDAFLTGEPLNFRRAPVPLDVQRRLEHAVATGQMDPVPAAPPIDWSHEIAFGDDGDWAISHPDGCPGRASGDCDVQRLANTFVPVVYRGVTGRYQCAVNDLGDRFLLGDRLDADLAAGRVADRLGGPPPAATAECGARPDASSLVRCDKPANHHGERHTATLPGGSFTWGYVPTPDEQTEG